MGRIPGKCELGSADPRRVDVADPSSPVVLHYARPGETGHTRLGIAASAIFFAVIVWSMIDVGLPRRVPETIGFAAWVVGCALTIPAYLAKGRKRYFAHVAAVLLVAAFLVWGMSLPTV